MSESIVLPRSGVTVIDRCPHRHRTQMSAYECAEVMCAMRNGQPKASAPVTSDCFRHGAFYAMFCPTCEKEAGRG